MSLVSFLGVDVWLGLLVAVVTVATVLATGEAVAMEEVGTWGLSGEAEVEGRGGPRWLEGKPGWMGGLFMGDCRFSLCCRKQRGPSKWDIIHRYGNSSVMIFESLPLM